MSAATLEMCAADYFASLNPVAKKIVQDEDNCIKSLGDKWMEMTAEEQEDVLQRYFVDESVRAKHEPLPDADELPEVFPRLKIQCGEKIVVDFENDCLTWRDEHSGPFSWKTRSQEDLSAFETANLITKVEDDGAVEKPKPKPRKKKARSPERDPVNLAFKPEKSIWDSPFLAADRGETGGLSNGEDEDGDLFKNFGMKLNLDMDNGGYVSDSKNIEDIAEESSVISEHGGMDQDSYFAGDDSSISKRTTSESTSVGSDRPPFTRLPSESPSREIYPDDKSEKKQKKRGFFKRKSSEKERPESEQSLMANLSISETSVHNVELSGGQLSPVFIQEVGESEDHNPNPPEFSYPVSDDLLSDLNFGQDVELHIRESDLFDKDNKDTTDAATNEEEDLPMSGFDFLDNW